MFLVFRQGGQKEPAMFRKIAISALGAATLLTAPVPALAMPFGNGLPVVKTESVQLIGHRHIRRNRIYYNSRRHYRSRDYRHRHYRHRRHSDGAAIVAGIIGLGAALAIANSNRRHFHYDDRYYGSAQVYGYQSGSPEWIAACARKYRSFEPRTGLYTAHSGYKRRCRLP
jgi:hypothetical protein